MSNPPTLPMTLRPRRRWLRVVAMILIFLGGMICGSGVTIIAAVRDIRYVMHNPGVVPMRITRYLTRRLDLTPDQAAQVKGMIARTQSHLQAIRRRNQPEVAMELAALRQEVGTVLTDEQRDRWDLIFDEAIDRWMPPVPAEDSTGGENGGGTEAATQPS